MASLRDVVTVADIPGQAVTAATEAIGAHRWKSMGTASVECECGEIIHGQSIALGPSFDPDGPGYETAAFPADEAFRRHLATAALGAAAPHIRAQAWRDGYGQGRDDERDWLTGRREPVVFGGLAHEAFCAGWEAAAPLIREQAITEVLTLTEQGIADGAAEVIAQAVAAEREHCAQLADQRGATYVDSHTWETGGMFANRPFADLLREDTP